MPPFLKHHISARSNLFMKQKVEMKKKKDNYSHYESNYFRENAWKTQEFFDKLTSLQKIETFRNLIDNEHINDLRESFWHLTINSEMWLKFFENTCQCAQSRQSPDTSSDLALSNFVYYCIIITYFCDLNKYQSF